MTAALRKLRRRLPEAEDDALLEDLLEEAAGFLKSYTGRPELPMELEDAQVRLAAILFNRMGMEGEASHNEGGVARAAESLPEDLRRWLNGWRLAKTL